MTFIRIKKIGNNIKKKFGKKSFKKLLETNKKK